MVETDSADPLLAVSRRRFLAAGGAGVVGFSLKETLGARTQTTGSVIQIVLNGGASHLETFDPKPHAPREIRGPLHSIATRMAGVRFSECLPRLAQRADQLVILRSLFHEAAPIHETGLQLLLTGNLVRRKVTPPHIGFIVRKLLKEGRGVSAAIELGGALHQTGTSASSGDLAGSLCAEQPGLTLPDADQLPSSLIPALQFSQAHWRVRDAYGETRFGQQLWTAARLIELGVRYVPVNTFHRLEGEQTWDAHGCNVGPATIFDYGNTLGPQFDRALSALIDDLQQTGLWKQVLIAVAGEMGRHPHVNDTGGRDHWTHAWSGLLAGGMLQSGQVIGETDEHGEFILNDPLDVGRIPTMLLEFLGIAPGTEITLQNGDMLQTPKATPIFS